MGIELTEVLEEAKASARKLQELMEKCGYDRFYDELGNVCYDTKDPDAAQTFTELNTFFELISCATASMEYIDKPIKYAGQLWKNKNDRFELDGLELSCGSTLEILIEKEGDELENNYMEWVRTRIEYNQQEQRYYAVGRPGMCLEGVIARKRG